MTLHMKLDVIEQGVETDTSNDQFVREAEQNAIYLAQLQATGAVRVDDLEVTSWNTLPVGLGEISSPASLANEAAEIRAVYPLYLSKAITGQGSAAITSVGQMILKTGVVNKWNENK